VIRILPNKVGLPVAAVIITAAALASLAVSTFAAQSASRGVGVSAEVRALVRQAMASTGLISVRSSSDPSSQAPRASGSGVLLRSDGIVITNHHVITNTRTNRSYDEIFLSLPSDGDSASLSTRYRLKPLLINKDYDLVLLRVESDAAGKPVPKSWRFPSIEIGDSRKIKTLDDLFIIGFPEKGGSTATVSHGVVEGKDLLANWIKTDARVIHGNSGGAAVNNEGKLVGIPTKVLSDEQGIDKDGDGFPDNYRRYGAVGFLRPSQLVAEMLAQLDNQKVDSPEAAAAPKMIESSALISVRGRVKSAAGGRPIAGALVGLLPLGETSITESSLLTWASTNADGEFRLNKPVPPGRYTIKAKALARQPYTFDIEVGPNSPALVIEMRSLSTR
jgi:S1-C subfamily serine protease